MNRADVPTMEAMREHSHGSRADCRICGGLALVAMLGTDPEFPVVARCEWCGSVGEAQYGVPHGWEHARWTRMDRPEYVRERRAAVALDRYCPCGECGVDRAGWSATCRREAGEVG